MGLPSIHRRNAHFFLLLTAAWVTFDDRFFFASVAGLYGSNYPTLNSPTLYSSLISRRSWRERLKIRIPLVAGDWETKRVEVKLSPLHDVFNPPVPQSRWWICAGN